VTWIGTCRNPEDGKDYIISYNDCCGKHVCGLCYCHRNEGDKPIYFASRANDINWCFGTQSVVYNCSTVVLAATPRRLTAGGSRARAHEACSVEPSGRHRARWAPVCAGRATAH
jgi:hypothetical protein